MPKEVEKFFSPGLIWSQILNKDMKDILIEKYLYDAFKQYLDLYLNLISSTKVLDINLLKEIKNGQIDYLEYRKKKDPARPLLTNLFGSKYAEELINDILFIIK